MYDGLELKVMAASPVIAAIVLTIEISHRL